MLPYLVLLILITVATLFDGKKIGSVLFFSLAIWMLVFSAFRVGGVGPGDYDTYLHLYSLTNTFEKVINPEIHAEIGFRALSLLGNYWGLSGQFIIIMMAVLAFVPVTCIIYKYSPYKILSLLVWMPYFLTMNMHSSRISVAAAFGLLFIFFYYNKRIFYGLLCLALAISFHSSALILIFVFLAKISLKKLLYILTPCLAIFVFISPFELMIKIFDNVGLSRLSTFVRIYISSEEYGYPMVIYDPRILLGMGVVFLIFKFQKKIITYFDIYFFKIYIIGVLFMILFSSVVIMAWRLSYFFLLVGVIVVPWLAKICNDMIQKRSGSKRVMSFVFTILYFLYTIPIILNAEPYEFF